MYTTNYKAEASPKEFSHLTLIMSKSKVCFYRPSFFKQKIKKMKNAFTILAVLVFSKMSYAQNMQGTSDTAAIRKILNSFTQAIIKKDSATLASLFANTPIAFVSVKGAETVAYLKKKDPSTSFIRIGNYKDFIAYVGQTTDQVEEKLYNVRIRTDGSVASLSSDYSFWSNQQKINWGKENWELIFNGTDWKIAAIIWSVNLEVVQMEPVKS
jgi:hypothetical protein